MATGQSTSNRRARRKRVSPAQALTDVSKEGSAIRRARAGGRIGIGLPGLVQALVRERSRLFDVQSILACLHLALLHARTRRSATQADYAGTTRIAWGLVRDCIDRLDAICVSSLAAQSKLPECSGEKGR